MFTGLQGKIRTLLYRLKLSAGVLRAGEAALIVNADANTSATSKLIELQVAGATNFSVNKAGDLTAGTTAAGIHFGASLGGGVVSSPNNGYAFTSSISNGFRCDGSGVGLTSGGWKSAAGNYLAWGSSQWYDTLDLYLYRDAAATLAQRNSTSPQNFRLYNTYTDASNYERAALTWSSNVAYLRNEKAGTGSARLMVVVTGSTTVSGLPSASVAGAGARAFVTDATSTTFLSTVAGGGANAVPVVSDGTNWLIG